MAWGKYHATLGHLHDAFPGCRLHSVQVADGPPLLFRCDIAKFTQQSNAHTNIAAVDGSSPDQSLRYF